MTWRREAPERPQQRQLAAALGDEDREGVDDEEDPDHQGDAGEDEQEGRDEAEDLVEPLLVDLDDLVAGAHLQVVGHDGGDRLGQLGLADALGGAAA